MAEMSRIGAAGRRIQDWTNRNVFIKSFDSLNDLPLQSYQNQTAAGSYAEGLTDIEETKEEAQVPASGDGHGASDGKPITALQAAWNVTNAIQGMFIVGLPFAVKVGGWITIGALILVAYVCYRTGLSLIECLYEDGRKVRYSYRDVAEAVRPGLGKFVLLAQLTELASTCILYLVLSGDLLQGCVPGVDKPAWMMLVSALLLGTAFLDDIRINPKEFKWMLSQSHIAAAAFKAIFGLIGFLTFAELTQKEISNSLPNQFFKVVVNLVLVVKALLSYQLPFYAMVQLLTDNFFRGVEFTLFSRGSTMNEQERRFNKGVIGTGIALMVIGVYYSTIELRDAMKYQDS
ncbi:vesicular GABA transporter [Aphelenchoides avenae]|nr:vesicular GABA transporter [Aphelenchus avenae]